jgi:hypothetical protein
MYAQTLAVPRALHELPPPLDLGDVWLEHALDRLYQACAATDAGARDDASILSVLFAGLAIESRINRIVRENDPEHWERIRSLRALDKFQLVPRLLHESNLGAHNELSEYVVELFDLRDELVEASPSAPPPNPAQACTMVTAAARVCLLLEEGDPAALEVLELAKAALPQARVAAAAIPAEAGDFPPDLIGS